MNREWHLAHPMGRNPSHDQRMAWHAEHAEVCSCRTPSPALAVQIAQWRAAQRPAGPPQGSTAVASAGEDAGGGSVRDASG